MPRDTRTLEAVDFLPLEAWAGVRKDHRKALSHRKRNRRVGVGPHVTLYFENWDTMWYQVQEMLWIEKGGAEQLPDELAAYTPMIPNGQELTATFMIEIPDEVKRRNILGQLGGIEDCISIRAGAESIRAVAETDLDRTTAAGKTSSVHFLHFPMSAAAMEAFRDPANEVMVRIDHPAYGHAAFIGDAVRAELTADLG